MIGGCPVTFVGCGTDAGWATSNTATRLISPDRPAVGLSDPKPGRTVLDWAADAEDLMKHLGVGRFAVMGWSMGGPYAAAVGYGLQAQVIRIAIIAGPPLNEPGVFAELPPIDRAYTRLSERAPWVARQCFRTMSWLAGAVPAIYGRLAARDLGAADGHVIRDEGFGAFARMSREALRQPSVWSRSTGRGCGRGGFAPEDLRIGADVWVGSEDKLLDPRWPHELARRIPQGTLHMRSGGHFMAHPHYREIFDALREI
jgi:pimeloyl-ACP methyl ester carboxylesterase